MYFGPKCGRKVAVMKDLVAVKGPKVAVGLGWSGSEGLLGSGNPDQGCQVAVATATLLKCGRRKS